MSHKTKQYIEKDFQEKLHNTSQEQNIPKKVSNISVETFIEDTEAASITGLKKVVTTLHELLFLAPPTFYNKKLKDTSGWHEKESE